MTAPTIEKIYAFPLYARYLLYRRGILRQCKLSKPVVSVGGLKLGGVGKTLLVETLAKFFLSRGRRPGILTRGYGRKSRERIVLPAGDISWRDVGDEPLLLSRKLPDVPIVVHPDRCASGKLLDDRVDLFILDDGFQHLPLARDLDIVALDGTEFSTGIFPFGWRRDGLWRLDNPEKVVIAAPVDRVDFVAEKLPGFEILPFETVPAGISTVDFRRGRPPEYIAGKRVFLCAGIANPHRFERSVKSLGAEVVGKKWFMDHKFFRKSQVEKVLQLAARKSADLILTTEKDAVKIAEFAPPIEVLLVRAEFHAELENIPGIAVLL